MTHTRDQVVAAAQAAFAESDLAEILTALDQYGKAPCENEVARVRLAIIQLSEGNKNKLLEFVKIAKVDYRDILAWQQTGPLSPEEGEKWQAAARALIRNWGSQ